MDDGVFEQVTNVARCLGSSTTPSACPTAIGATAFPSAAWRPWTRSTGVISPGGIGFDINCGMRLVLTNLTYDGGEAAPPASWSTGSSSASRPGSAAPGFVKLSQEEFRQVVEQGAPLVRGARATAGRRTWS